MHVQGDVHSGQQHYVARSRSIHFHPTGITIHYNPELGTTHLDLARTPNYLLSQAKASVNGTIPPRRNSSCLCKDSIHSSSSS